MPKSGKETAHNQNAIYVRGENIYIKGTPASTKEKFFEMLRNKVCLLNKNRFRDVVGERTAHACFRGVVYPSSDGKRLENAVVYVNIDDYIIDGIDYTDLIPITVQHEIAELWTYAKTGYSMSPAPKGIDREEIAHNIALHEEYRYALQLGKAERYLDFIRRWWRKNSKPIKGRRLPEEIVLENETAYYSAKIRKSRSKNRVL